MRPTAVREQARTELALTLRRGESLLLTLGVPIGILLFFSVVDVLPLDVDDPVDFLAPGTLALAIMSTAMVNVAIATGFERQYGVLKRLGATPLGRPGLLTGKVAAVLAVEALQAALVVVVALALRWDPAVSALVIVAALLGTVAFAGLGMLMAGTMRGEATLAAANGLYVVLLLLGGMVVPLAELPAALRAVAEVLPAAPLADAIRGTLTPGVGVATRSWLTLAAWSVAAPVAAARLFRWE